ncbi:uncharacterized protein LOC111384248 [Olea europaea var. sylvestris]|uniref:uncharacterized protein LOC111384248 n=1 Tax=Olea europaea var. sylvestris TaxID=158386 RepID=UPI000C1D1930|nr:uncharacterized protein LOC111384248 [Olea europaea var. sylvestris]
MVNAYCQLASGGSSSKQDALQANCHSETDSEEDEDVVGTFSHRCNTLSHRVVEKDDVPLKETIMEEAKARICRAKGLMYIDVKINGKTIRAMVDTGAIYNYLTCTEVERLGLVLEKDSRNVKAINSAAQPMAGVAKSVLIKAGPFKGKINLSAVQMDDFKLILGLKFLRDTKTAVLPYFDSLMMMGNKLLIQEFEDIMPEELAKKLPPRRTIDHEIELIPGAKPPARAPYHMSQPKLEELRKQLGEMLESRIIVPAKSPYGAPVLFQKKADGSLRMFLDDFVVVYLDDIVIYSETLEEHVQHVRQVFNRLRENELYVKPSKCSFAQTSINFLGHIIEQGKIRMDSKKVTTIKDWQPSKTVHDVRSFLGLSNYYRRFVKGYSEIALPLTELTKKDKDWGWSSQCQAAFERFKKSMSTNPILALPDMAKLFEVHTNASDFTLGGVLMQEEYPVAYESRKLKTEHHYSAYENELLAVVHCLRGWRHYLLGSPFIVKTDNTVGAQSPQTLETNSNTYGEGPGYPIFGRPHQNAMTQFGQGISERNALVHYCNVHTTGLKCGTTLQHFVLKPYFADKEDTSRNEPKRHVFELKKAGKKVAEAILDH